MISLIKNFLTCSKNKTAFESLPSSFREIVFYAENVNDWPHIGPLIESLLKKGQNVSYLTSDKKDPRLDLENKNFKSFYIGEGSARTLLFLNLNAKVCVTTLPDLHCFAWKRSHFPVHYIYIFHSLVSTHMVYKKKAFDNYDTVFVSSKYHITEIRKNEDVYKLKRKNIFHHGYGRLDSLLKNKPENLSTFSGAQKLKIVFASTWGRGSIIENDPDFSLVKEVLNLGHDLSVRLHPMTTRRFPDLEKRLAKVFSEFKSLSIITDMNSKNDLYDSDVMIGDWSGAAYDYAFTLNRPVIFVNTPPKVNNPDYNELSIQPFEVSVREKIGKVLQIGEFEKLNGLLENLRSNYLTYQKNIKDVLESNVFNIGNSSEIGAEEIIKIKSL
ncbi:MAG: CDP-glycerol glycerophosphotransferase family protein [Bdellovibrionota bacterium]